MRRFFLFLTALGCIALPSTGLAQANENPIITVAPAPAPPGTYNITWPTTAGRHYYLQVSPTIQANTWTYGPVAKTGTGENLVQPITVSTTPPGRCFLRIQWFTDADRAPAADFDGDGISNFDEVNIFGSHPFVNDGSDYDKDGLTDSQEVAAGTNPLRFDMPELRVMTSWRDALIEDWRTHSPNDYQWPNFSAREVRARAYNTSSTPAPYPDPNTIAGLNIRKEWSDTSRDIVHLQIPNIFAGNATSLLWNDLMPPAQPPAAFAWGDAVETGTSIGAWMLQSFSYASPVKVHTIRARAVRVYLKASRPMPILFRARFKVRKSTRDDPAGAYFTPPNVSPATYDRAIQPGSTESNTFEINPATDLAALPGSLGLNQHYTVHEVYYAITAEAFPFSGEPLPAPAVDTDFDGLPDPLELNIGTDPQNSDTDGDGRADLLDYLSPWPGAYVIAGGPGGSGSAATPPPLAPEIPLIQSITRTGHTCPSSSFNDFGINLNLSAAVTIWHWLNGSRYQTVANPPLDAITTIKNAWTPIPPSPPLPLMALNFPAPGVDAENGILNNMSINEMIMDVGPFGSRGIRTSYSSLRSYNYGTTSAPNYAIGGDALERKVRLNRSTTPPSALSRSYLLVDRKKTDTSLTAWTVTTVTPVTLTIPANQTTSNTIDLAVPASVPPAPGKISRHEMALLPVELKVTDFATKADAVPYTATAGADAPKNSELCLKADKATEKAKIEIVLPSITDAALLAKLRWKVVRKPANTAIQEAVFTATPAAVELFLGSGASVEDEILFEVQVGADGGTFTAAWKMNVRVVRDRLNWWLEPFSPEYDWRTAKPESRAGTGDYPSHKATAYERECLESVYAFFKDNAPGIPPNFGSTASDAGQAKTRSWIKSQITCFSEFHDKLKTPNNNQLIDLNSITPLKLSLVLDLEGAAGRPNLQRVLKHLVEKQTNVTVSSLPLSNYTNQKGAWAKNAAAQLNDTRLAYYDLLAFWQKEGSMDVRSSPEQTSAFPAFQAPAPTSGDEAKVIFIAQVFWQNFGMDSLNPHLGAGADNRPVLANLASAVAHIQSQVDRLLGAGQGEAYFATLGAAASSPGIYDVTSGEAFYTFTLRLLGRMILTDYWRPQGIVATYCSYNMGAGNFNLMVTSLASTTYPERGRLGLEDWGWHYEVRVGEWANPPADWPANKPGIRPNATRFWYFREIFKNLTTP